MMNPLGRASKITLISHLRVASTFGSLRGFYGDHKYDEHAFCSNPDGFRF
jgi:hypothetical protein